MWGVGGEGAREEAGRRGTKMWWRHCQGSQCLTPTGPGSSGHLHYKPTNASQAIHHHRHPSPSPAFHLPSLPLSNIAPSICSSHSACSRVQPQPFPPFRAPFQPSREALDHLLNRASLHARWLLSVPSPARFSPTLVHPRSPIQQSALICTITTESTD